MNNRIWSLWDMYEIGISEYHEAVVVIQQAIHASARPDPSTQMASGTRTSTIGMLDRVKTVIHDLHLPVTKLTVSELRDELSWFHKEITYFACGQLLMNLSQTMRRELQSVKIFTLEHSKADFFAPKEPLFGADVAANFPSIAYDIDECGKCYALGRSTASVFHAIRCLEAAIRAIYRCLGLADPIRGVERNWGMILKKINEAMDTKWPKATRIGGDGTRFEGFVASLTSMQNPYRNATMHLDEKYTEGEAKYIFEMVGGLMRSVALRMDEEGLPLAR